MLLRTVLLATLATLLATLMVQAPAGAATVSTTDRVGDAPPYIDITAVTVRNSADRLVVTATVPGLDRRGGFGFGYSDRPIGGLIVLARRNGAGPRLEAVYCGKIRCHDVHCPGLRVRYGRDRVTAVVPQRCYPGVAPDPAVVSVTSGARDAYDAVRAVRVRRG
jgi:hypothetical protein